MERIPTRSTLKCIGEGCKEIPTHVLIGRHVNPAYEVQILACEAHLPEAREYAKNKRGRIRFQEFKKPSWLARAQKAEKEQAVAN